MNKLHIHCDTIPQFKALREIQRAFIPECIIKLELITDGIRITDITGAQADFICDTAGNVSCI